MRISGFVFTRIKRSDSPSPAGSLALLEPQQSLVRFADLPPPSLQTVSLQELQQDFENPSPTDPNNNQTPANGAGGVSYITFSPDSPPASHCELPAPAETPSEPTDMLASVPPFVTFHTLILDMSGVSFVDLMGIKALAKVRPLCRGSTGHPRAHPHSCSPTLALLGAFILTS